MPDPTVPPPLSPRASQLVDRALSTIEEVGRSSGIDYYDKAEVARAKDAEAALRSYLGECEALMREAADAVEALAQGGVDIAEAAGGKEVGDIMRPLQISSNELAARLRRTLDGGL